MLKEKKGLKILYLLALGSIFLPWFTFDAKMMGYRHGWLYLDWFAVQNIIIGIYSFGKKRGRVFTFLTEVSLFMNLVALVLVFRLWQGRANIILGFQWRDGFITAQPGYWISVVLFLALFVMFQKNVLKCK